MAREKSLTNAGVERLQSKASRYEVGDPDAPGLRLVVQASGAKSFAFRYSFSGQDRKMTLGQWPAMKLAETVPERQARLAAEPNSLAPDARSAWHVAKSVLAAGRDPGAEKKAARQVEVAKTKAAKTNVRRFETEFESFLNRPNKRTGQAKRGSSRDRYLSIIKPVKADWAARDVTKISQADCEDVLAAASERGAHAAASLYMLLNGFFHWAHKRKTITENPMLSVDRLAATSDEGRALNDDELRIVWKATAHAGVFGRIVKLLLLTGQRRMEVASLEWSEIDFAEKVWNVPASKAKNGKAHSVPLSDEALAVIRECPRIDRCAYVFKAEGPEHYKGFSKGKKFFDKLAPIGPWHLHTLRHTFLTRLARLGISPVVAEKIVNHSGDVLKPIAKIYNHHSYLGEARAAMTLWADELARIAISDGSNVVELRQPEVVAS